MNVNVNWNHLPHPRNMNHYIEREAEKLGRHLPRSGRMDVRFAQEGLRYRAKVHVQAMGRDWWATGEGHDFWTGMANAVESLLRRVDEFKVSLRKRGRHTRDMA
jgi:ribosomal subunit interface protein